MPDDNVIPMQSDRVIATVGGTVDEVRVTWRCTEKTSTRLRSVTCWDASRRVRIGAAKPASEGKRATRPPTSRARGC